MEALPGVVAGAPAILVLALALEMLVGDPVTRWHPVAVFGRTASFFVDRAPRGHSVSQLAYGGALVGGATALVFLGSALALEALASIGGLAVTLVGAGLLKTSFSIRQLEHEAARVAELLEREGVAAARRPLAALVSRDLDSLSPRLAASAAVESLAENLSDSFVAPLFYFVILGVPGALAYRVVNTLDAMIGYHGDFEYLGRAAARLDDVVSFVPSRLTALLLVLAAGLSGADSRAAAAIGFRDHRKTASPNAGWPMAVMAGALGVELEKAGHYSLGAPGHAPSARTITAAISTIRWAAALMCAITLLVLLGGSLAR